MSRNLEAPAQCKAQAWLATPDSPLPLGAHLVTERKGYEHHGIYVGDGLVVHYAGLSRRLGRGVVEKISIAGFACGFSVVVRLDVLPRYDGDEVARRADSRLGECDYRLLTNNCEHFCSWCLCGECRSVQVDACMRNPVRAARTLLTLMLLALGVHWRSALPSPLTA